MSDNSVSDNVSTMEFTFPVIHEDDEGISYVTIDFNVTEWFRERFVDGYDEYPPASHDACTALAQHFGKNHRFYYNNGIIRDAYDGEGVGVTDAESLKVEMDAGNLEFTY